MDQEIASLLSQHQDAVQRLAEVPGLCGFGAADIAEVGVLQRHFLQPNTSPRGRSMSWR